MLVLELEEVMTGAKPLKPRVPNPMVLLFGPGPSTRRCDTCTELSFIRVPPHHECSYRKLAHAHKPNWPSCSKYVAIA